MYLNKRYQFLILFLVLLQGCASTKYPNWQQVRIEYKVPNKNCEYKIQDACSSTGAKCFNWFKKRATLYGANTVVITENKEGFISKGSAFMYHGTGGANEHASTTMTGLADYYYCPSNTTNIK